MDTKLPVAVGPPENPASPNVPPELTEWVATCRAQNHAGGRHYTLAELQELVAQRITWGEYWDLPEHLTRCPLCLELFESLLQGVPDVDPEILARMVTLDARGLRRWFRLVPPLPKLARIAAVLAVLALGGWYLVTTMMPPTVAVVAGTVQLADGHEIGGGGQLPGGGAALQVMQPVTARFADGSEIVLERNSRFAFETSRRHGQKVQLAEGKAICQVTKQKDGQRFQVLTPVGEVTVVGTRFIVSSQKVPDVTPDTQDAAKSDKPALRFLHPLLLGAHDDSLLRSAERPGVVTVQVQEGVVLVRNRYGYQTRLTVGQMAILRDHLRVIDVFSMPR